MSSSRLLPAAQQLLRSLEKEQVKLFGSSSSSTTTNQPDVAPSTRQPPDSDIVREVLSSLEPLVWLPQQVLSSLLPNGSTEAAAFASSLDAELGWAAAALHRGAANSSHTAPVSSSTRTQPALHDALGATTPTQNASAVPQVSGRPVKLTWKQRLHLAPVPSAGERGHTQQQPQRQTAPVSPGLPSSLLSSDGGRPLLPSLPSLRHAMTRCGMFLPGAVRKSGCRHGLDPGPIAWQMHVTSGSLLAKRMLGSRLMTDHHTPCISVQFKHLEATSWIVVGSPDFMTQSRHRCGCIIWLASCGVL